MAQTLTLPASLNALAALHPFVEEVAASLGQPVHGQLLLAIHELCTNIIRHAYDGMDGEIDVEAECTRRSIKFLIRDNAPRAYAMPWQIDMPDPLNPPGGGWGMYIVYQVMNEVEYRRLLDGNQWILQKYLDY